MKADLKQIFNSPFYRALAMMSGLTFANFLSSAIIAPGRNGEDNFVRTYVPKVLIAMPQKDTRIRERIAQHLSEAGYRVVTTQNGMETLNAVKEFSLDAVVMATEIEESKNSALSIFRTLSTMDHLLPVLSVGPYAHSEEFFGYARKFSRLSTLRSDPEQMTVLSHDLDELINNSVNGVRAMRDSLYRQIQNHTEEIFDYNSFVRSHPIMKGMDRHIASPELGAWMEYRYRRIPDPENGFIELRSDSAEGTVSAPVFAPLDPTRKYNKNSAAFLIKRIGSREDAQVYIHDFEHNSLISGVKLPELIKYHQTNQGEVFGLFRMYIAPTSAKVMKKLNEAHADPRIKEAIINTLLDRAARWALQTRHEVYIAESSLAAEKNLYIKRFSEALLRSPAVNEGEATQCIDAFSQALETIIVKHAHCQSRLLDSSPYNSGIELGKLEPSAGEIIELLGRRPQDTVERLLRNWDENTDNKPRDMFEEFIHITESYEAQLPERKKVDLYVNFLKNIMPREFILSHPKNSAAMNEYFIDFLWMGLYKSVRKQDLAASYAEALENQWAHFKINDLSVYEEKQRDYAEKARHFATCAAKYASTIAQLSLEHQSSSFFVNVNRTALILEQYKDGKPSDANNPLVIATQKLLRPNI